MDKLHRFVFEHRRILAAVCTGLAVLAGLGAVRQSPDGIRVLVTSHDLVSGRVITGGDVRMTVMPEAARPAHPLTESDAVGRRVAGPMRKGEALTDYRVLRPDALGGYGTGAVLTTVRVSDGVTGVQVGDRLNVIAVDPHGEDKAKVVARDVEVVTLPTAGEAEDAIPLGIVTTEQVALVLAAAALESRFIVVSSAS